MKKSELCAAAQNHLWNGRSYMRYSEGRRITEFICNAVTEAAINLPEHLLLHSFDASTEIQEDINSYLGGCTFQRFLQRQGIPAELYKSPKWRQLRRKEFLCMLQSKYEREGN